MSAIRTLPWRISSTPSSSTKATGWKRLAPSERFLGSILTHKNTPQALEQYRQCLLLLRDNRFIDYKQLGFKFRLFKCEALYNWSDCGGEGYRAMLALVLRTFMIRLVCLSPPNTARWPPIGWVAVTMQQRFLRRPQIQIYTSLTPTRAWPRLRCVVGWVVDTLWGADVSFHFILAGHPSGL